MMKLITTIFAKSISTEIIDPLFAFIKDETRFLLQSRLLDYQVELFNSLYKVKNILHRKEVVFIDIYEPISLIDYDGNKHIPIDIFRYNKKITLLGEAGIGKSSLIRYYILNLIYTKTGIPILIELRNFNDKDINFDEYIRKEIFKFENISDSESIQTRLLESGKFSIIFDGFDELTKEKKIITIKQIKKFSTRFTDNQYIITSRPFTNVEYLSNFSNYQIDKLSPTQIENFVRRQFSKQKISKLPESIILSINDEKNSTYFHFLQNPLLLSLFILTYNEHAGLPQKRSIFYSDIFETLFHTHNSLSKLGYERKLDTGLDKEKLENILQCFSFLSFFEKRYTFSLDYFDKTINLIKEKKRYKFQSRDLLTDLIVSIGILTKDGQDYFFPHKTLHEYFVASHITNLPRDLKIDVFNKLNEVFFHDNKLADLSNLYILLMELDFYDVTELFLIPTLAKLQSDNKKILSEKKELLERQFFLSLEMLRLFNFEDFYLLEPSEKFS
jgi:predicted NACHT family NTPase